MFWLCWHFYALSAIRIRPPSCYNVKAFPKCLLAAYAFEHTMCTMCIVFELSERLSSAAHLWCTHVHREVMFGHRISDFTSLSLNIYHASQTICKRSAANVLIFMGKSAMLMRFYTGFVKRSSVNFARRCNLYTGIAIFTLLEKYVLSCKNCTVFVNQVRRLKGGATFRVQGLGFLFLCVFFSFSFLGCSTSDCSGLNCCTISCNIS